MNAMWIFQVTSKRLRNRGTALIVTLALVVTISIMVVTFVSITRMDRTATAGYSQGIRAEQLATGGLQTIIGNLQQEIASSGSAEEISGFNVYTNVTGSNILPQPTGTNSSMPDLVKISTNTPFFSTGTQSLKASGVNSTTENAKSRAIRLSRWNRPALGSFPDETAAPQWVYVTREGAADGSAFTFGKGAADASNPVLSNTNYVLGRFAYAIYNVGNLMDITVAGYPGESDLKSTDIQGKGALAFADLTEIPGLEDPTKVDALIAWRNKASLASSYASYVTGTAPDLGWAQVVAGDNTFVNRMDLISYAQQNGIASALPYLTTFSRELNSPSIPAGTDPSANPDFRKLFLNKQPLQRFALSRFKLFDQDPSALSDDHTKKILDYFGLSPASGASNTWRAWTYRSSSIGTPADAIATGRPPDLFELLKAAIVRGSLGPSQQNSAYVGGILVQYTGASNPANYPPDAVDDQVARIVANLIDQTTANNYPTTISMGTGSQAVTVYGIKSLPYFCDWAVQVKFPSGNWTDTTGAYFQMRFKLWNPHQSLAPSFGPTKVRIVVNPEATYSFAYENKRSALIPPQSNLYENVWNSGWWQNFPASLYPANGGLVITSLDTFTTPALTSIISLAPPDKPFPAALNGDGTHLVSMGCGRTTFSLQYQDGDGKWRTYSTFAGYDNDAGNTGFQMSYVTTGLETYYYTSDPNWQRPIASFPKPDPRTFRTRVGYSPAYNSSGKFVPDAAMVPTDPGQMVRQGTLAFPGNAYVGMSYMNSGAYAYVRDNDGTARNADGYLGINPMQTASMARPVILNRPFRSIGELGYVFRDAPWKSLNFFSADSGDAALLDLFCMEDAKLTHGKVSLNTPHQEILRAILKGTSRIEGGPTISDTEASTIAADIATLTSTSPLTNRADIVTKFSSTNVTGNYPAEKIRREAPIRALSSVTQTRTWNLMIDIIAQSGRFTAGAKSLDEFIVKGERRYWLHVAIDRITGDVLETQIEPVYE